MTLSYEVLRERQNTVRYNWGFRFALWCALFWGLSYLGLGMLSKDGPFLSMSIGQLNPFFGAGIIALIIALIQAAVSIVWTSFYGSFSEWRRFIFRFDRINLYYLLSALCSGSVAWLAYVALIMTDATFAVAMVMFYPIFGALIANRWYQEKVFKQCIVGLIIIGIGCGVLYLPNAFGASGISFALIIIIGMLVGLGWGLESTIATRAMDVTSANLGASVRLTYEALIWLAIAVLVAVFSPDRLELSNAVISVFSEQRTVLLLVVASVALAFNYFSWYQSFLLCGVCRGLAVSDLSSFVTVLVGMIILIGQPSPSAVIACLLMLFGVFLVYFGQAGEVGVLRDVNLGSNTKELVGARPRKQMTLKSQVLVMIAECDSKWDHQIVNEVLSVADSPWQQKRLARRTHLALIESAAAGLIKPVEDAIDDGSHFHEGRLNTCYQLTVFGSKRLESLRLVSAIPDTTQDPIAHRRE